MEIKVINILFDTTKREIILELENGEVWTGRNRGDGTSLVFEWFKNNYEERTNKI